MNKEEEILKKLNDIQNKLEIIESDIEDIEDKKKLRERPLNFWEFLIRSRMDSSMWIYINYSIYFRKDLIKAGGYPAYLFFGENNILHSFKVRFL